MNNRIKIYGVFIFIAFFTLPLRSAQYTITNATSHSIYAIIDTISWPNYEQEINAGKTWIVPSIACGRKVMVRGKEGAVRGLYQQINIPGSGCGNYTVTVEAKDIYTDPVVQQPRARYLELDIQ